MAVSLCKVARLIIAAAVVSLVFSTTSIHLETASANAQCTSGDIHVVFARGSGAELGGPVYEQFRDQIRDRIDLDNVKVTFYELGSSPSSTSSYPAVSVFGWTTWTAGLGAQASGGASFKYGQSVTAGVNELKQHLIMTSIRCPDTKIVLGGHSQGAQVIGQALPDLHDSSARNIVFVALFGDPKLHLPEGEGINPPACRNQQFSDWRRVVPNCHTDDGTLGARKPYITDKFIGRVGLWCNDKDWICGSSKNAFINSGHMQYHNEGGAIERAALEIIQRLARAMPKYKKYFNTSFGQEVDSQGDRTYATDVVIVVDRNGTTSFSFQSRMNAAIQAAEKHWSQGKGRVAIVTWCAAFNNVTYNSTGFLENNSSSRAHLDDFIENNQYCGTLRHDSAHAHAMTVALDSVQWRPNTEKAIQTLSEYTPSDPSNALLKSYITRRAAEIDPVNIYIISKADEDMSFVDYITDATAGRAFIYDDTSDVDEIINRVTEYIIEKPLVRFWEPAYMTTVGQPIALSVWSSLDGVDDHRMYRWDFESDGAWDLETRQSIAVIQYTETGEKLVHAEVVGSDGSRGSMTATVIVDAEEVTHRSTVPVVTGFTYDVLKTTNDVSIVRLAWNPVDTPYLLLSVNGTHLGYIDGDRTTIDITDINRTEDVVIELQLVNDSYDVGDRRGIILPGISRASSLGQVLSSTSQDERSSSSILSTQPLDGIMRYTEKSQTRSNQQLLQEVDESVNGGVMDKVIVTIGAIVAIGCIAWWFFGKHKTTEVKATAAGNGQEALVVVDGGYTPNTVTLQKDIPAKIVFERKDPSNCFNEVVFPDFGIHEVLPVGKRHVIEVDTSKTGEYQYACGMNMFHGKIVVK